VCTEWLGSGLQIRAMQVRLLSLTPDSGVVVQLVRIPACHAGGRGFESRPLRQVFESHNARTLPSQEALGPATVALPFTLGSSIG
jgi:hypothetical protein